MPQDPDSDRSEYKKEWRRRKREDPAWVEQQRAKQRVNSARRRADPEKSARERERARERYRENIEENREKHRERQRYRRAEDPERHRADGRKQYAKRRAQDPAGMTDRERCKAYGLEPGQFEAMWDAQGRVCAICGCVPKIRSNARDGRCVDHRHSDGLVRGILCQRCNHRLAALDDSGWLEAAYAYLHKADQQ